MTVVDVVSMLRKSWKLILLCMLAGVLVAAGYSALQPRVYQATSTGYLIAGGADGTVPSAQSGNTFAAQKAQQYLPLANTRAVADRLAGHLANDPSGASPSAIEATIVPSSNILQVSANGPTAAEAQAVADAGVKAMADEIHRLETLNPNAATTNENGSLDEIPTDGTSSIALVPFEPASLPSSPISPDWTRNLVIGLAAGLVLGVLLAILRRLLDLRVRTSQDVEELSDASVLAVVPATSELSKQRKGGKGMARMGLASESLRQLRTNLRFVSVDDPPRSIVVTSANPGEGKSTVASNLARVLSEAGQPTVLIDADLRRPIQARAFELDNSIGLTQVLAGDVSIEDALQRTETPLLRLMPSGRIPANPSELVGSRHMAQVLKELSKQHMVIIDAPPLLPVTDAGLLTAAADGAILVVRVGRTYKEQVKLSSKRLRQVEGKLLGSVMNLAPRQSMGEVMYGYGKGFGYSSSYMYYGEEQKKLGKRKGKALERKPVPTVEQPGEVARVDGSMVESRPGTQPAQPGPAQPHTAQSATQAPRAASGPNAGPATGQTARRSGSTAPRSAGAPVAQRSASRPPASRPSATRPAQSPSSAGAPDAHRYPGGGSGQSPWARTGENMDPDATANQPAVGRESAPRHEPRR